METSGILWTSREATFQYALRCFWLYLECPSPNGGLVEQELHKGLAFLPCDHGDQQRDVLFRGLRKLPVSANRIPGYWSICYLEGQSAMVSRDWKTGRNWDFAPRRIISGPRPFSRRLGLVTRRFSTHRPILHDIKFSSGHEQRW